MSQRNENLWAELRSARNHLGKLVAVACAACVAALISSFEGSPGSAFGGAVAALLVAGSTLNGSYEFPSWSFPLRRGIHVGAIVGVFSAGYGVWETGRLGTASLLPYGLLAAATLAVAWVVGLLLSYVCDLPPLWLRGRHSTEIIEPRGAVKKDDRNA